MNAPVSRPIVHALREPPEGAEQLRSIPDYVPMPTLGGKDGSPPAIVYDYRNADGSRSALIMRTKTAEGKRIA